MTKIAPRFHHAFEFQQRMRFMTTSGFKQLERHVKNMNYLGMASRYFIRNLPEPTETTRNGPKPTKTTRIRVNLLF